MQFIQYWQYYFRIKMICNDFFDEIPLVKLIFGKIKTKNHEKRN